MDALNTTGEVIDALGGTQATAAVVGCALATVTNWRKIGLFPCKREVYFLITEALAERGLRASPYVWKGIPPDALPLPDGP